MQKHVISTRSDFFPFLALATTRQNDEILVIVSKWRTQALSLFSLSGAHPSEFIVEVDALDITTHHKHDVVAIASTSSIIFYNYVTKSVVNKVMFEGTFAGNDKTMAWNKTGKLLTAAFEVQDYRSYSGWKTTIYTLNQSGSRIYGVYVTESIPDLHCSWTVDGNYVAIGGINPRLINIYTPSLKYGNSIFNTSMIEYGPKPYQEACWRYIEDGWYLEVLRYQNDEQGHVIARHSSTEAPERPKIIWSPDGTKLFFTNEANGELIGLIYDVTHDTIQSIPEFGREIAAAQQVIWSNDSLHLIYISDDGTTINRLSL